MQSILECKSLIATATYVDIFSDTFKKNISKFLNYVVSAILMF